MLDNPPAAVLIAEARKALEEGLAPGFPQKVAANAVGIAERELELGPEFAAAEMTRRRASRPCPVYGPATILTS